MGTELGNVSIGGEEHPMTRPAQAKVVAAIPSLNTESVIEDVVSRAKKCVNQVIVVNDGSHDSTAEKASASGAIVVNHHITKGYGEAIKSCFEVAKAESADVLVILDGDGQHNPDDISKVLDPILSGKADLVIGSRFLGGKTNVPRYRKFGIQFITFLYNLGSRTKVSDAQSGFRAYGKKVIAALTLTEKGMSVSIEMLVKARRKGFIIAEVPISCLYKTSRPSLEAVRHGLVVTLGVFRLRLKKHN